MRFPFSLKKIEESVSEFRDKGMSLSITTLNQTTACSSKSEQETTKMDQSTSEMMKSDSSFFIYISQSAGLITNRPVKRSVQ